MSQDDDPYGTDPYGNDPYGTDPYGDDPFGDDDAWAPRPAPHAPPQGPPLGRGTGRARPPATGGGRGGGSWLASSRMRLVLGVAIVGLVLLGAVGVWVQRQIDPPGSPGEVRTVTVPKGATSSQIGDLLADEGIIASSFVWDWYLRINGGGPFEAGDYELAADSSMGDVVDALSRGPKPPEQRRFTVPEGFTVQQTLARLADPEKGLGFDLATMQQILDSGQIRSSFVPGTVTSAEGLLFPDTYEVRPEATPDQVLAMMVGQLDATLTALRVETAQTDLHLTPYEVLIAASLIEEEAKVPEERPMVARVIYNRLKQGIPLGIDATSRYEAEITRGDRRKVDFTSTSPYNTRKVKGLPPTPIASPGRASIDAALHPADGPCIYYVLKDAAGHHTFTDSAAEFARAKQRCKEAGLGCG
jgi:UPF0755 protein